MSKNTKKIQKYADEMKRTYGFTSVEIDDNHDHPQMIGCTDTNITVKCMGLPNTSGTEFKHVAQNALKRMREGMKLGKSVVAYGGGKA